MENNESLTSHSTSLDIQESEAKANSAKFANDLLKLSLAGIVLLSVVIFASAFLGDRFHFFLKNSPVILFFVLPLVSFCASICLSIIRQFATVAEVSTTLKFVQMQQCFSDKSVVDGIPKRTGYNNFAQSYFYERKYSEDDPEIEIKMAADQRDMSEYLKNASYNLLKSSAALFFAGVLMIAASIILLLVYVAT